MKRDEVLAQLAACKSTLVSRYGVERLALFGSTARDAATAIRFSFFLFLLLPLPFSIPLLSFPFPFLLPVLPPRALRAGRMLPSRAGEGRAAGAANGGAVRYRAYTGW